MEHMHWKPFYLCLTMSAELMKLQFVHRPSVSLLSLNLVHRFLSNLGCCFPWAIRSDKYFSLSLTSIGNHIWRVQWHHHIWPWVTLKSQSQGHSDFKALYLAKEQLGHILLLNINRKAYMGVYWCDYIWPWVTLKGQYQSHTDFKGLYLEKQLS